MQDKGTFWQFSLALYANSKVQSACLALQNQYSADVNIVLFLLYQAHLGKQLSDQAIRQLDKEVSLFRERVILPIRALRQSLKGKIFSAESESEPLYQNMLSFELSAEKVEQKHLEAIDIEFIDAASIQHAAQSNLYAYAKLLNINLPNTEIDTLVSHSTT